MLHSYEQLVVWQKSMDLVEVIYRVTALFPDTEKFGLVSQMRRAAVSIPSNIAEGRRRGTRKDFCNFLYIAYSSGGELETQIKITKRLPFGKLIDFAQAESLLEEVMRMLNTMISKLRTLRS